MGISKSPGLRFGRANRVVLQPHQRVGVPFGGTAR